MTDEERQIAKALFLAEFSVSFHLGRAADAAGVSRKTIVDWRKSDAEFDNQIAALWEGRTDTLEGVAFELAQSEKTPPSVRAELLKFLLNNNRPTVYNHGSGRRNSDAAEETVPIITIFLGPKPDPDKLPPGASRMLDAPAQEIISNEKE